MKRILLVGFVLAMLTTRLSAQQEPAINHYMFTKLFYNPAYAGSNNGICIDLLEHAQYTNFKGMDGESGPSTQGFGINGPLFSAGSPHGGGIHAMIDKEGFIGMTSFYGSYSYKIPRLAIPGDLRIGANVGLVQKTLDPNWKPQDPNDPRLPGTSSHSTWDAGAGVYYTSLNWWAGASMVHIPGNKVTWTGGGLGASADYYIARTFFLSAGYNYKLKSGGGKWMLQPSFLIRRDQARTGLELNAMALYDQTFWGAVNFSAERLNAVSIMAGMYFSKLFSDNKNPIKGLKVGYCYNVATSQATAFGGTHEIYIGYCFNLNIETPPTVNPVDVRHLGHDPF